MKAEEIAQLPRGAGRSVRGALTVEELEAALDDDGLDPQLRRHFEQRLAQVRGDNESKRRAREIVDSIPR